MTGISELSQRPLQPTAAYVHVPFCRHRCGYCNFTLIAGRDDLISAYLDALDRELSALETPRPVETLYLGGGTPSHLPPDQLRRLLTIVNRWFPGDSASSLLRPTRWIL
ncbi:MAG: radical SAM protein [Pirellulales bacterium]